MTTTPSSQFHSQLLLLPVILLVILAATAQAQGQQPMARPGCPDKCGNISIPFPFGIGKPGCFRPGFQVVCNHSSDPPRAFLAGSRRFKGEAYSNDSQSYSDSSWSPLELVSISVATGEARVYAPIAYRCSTKNNESFSTLQEMDFSDSPFTVSATRNVLIGVGLRAEAELTWAVDEFYGTSFTCRADDALFSLDVWNGTCTGWGCSERILPPDKGSGKSFSLSVNTMEKGWWWNETKPCGYGLLVEKSWYNFSKPEDMEGDKTLLKRFPRGVPLVLDFVAGNTWCPAEGQPSPLDYACVSGNSSCANATYTTHPSYICKCWEGYDGNPYIAHGCQDIDECKLPEVDKARAKMLYSSKLIQSKPAKIGPWGGNGGSERDVQTKPTQLVSVTINSGDIIDAISFTYVGTDNVQYFSGKLGGTGGSEDKISLDPTNYVTEISGTIGKFQWNDVVTSLKIVTLKWDKTYGRDNGTPFRIPVLDGGKIAGFFGRSGNVLDAIGVYVTP